MPIQEYVAAPETLRVADFPGQTVNGFAATVSEGYAESISVTGIRTLEQPINELVASANRLVEEDAEIV
jgi:hypothetical protein